MKTKIRLHGRSGVATVLVAIRNCTNWRDALRRVRCRHAVTTERDLPFRAPIIAGTIYIAAILSFLCVASSFAADAQGETQSQPSSADEGAASWEKAVAPVVREALGSAAPLLARVSSEKIGDKTVTVFRAESGAAFVIEYLHGGDEAMFQKRHGEWFETFDIAGQYIRKTDFSAERAVLTNFHGDGSVSLIWQKGTWFVEVRQRGNPRPLALAVHAAAEKHKLYEFVSTKSEAADAEKVRAFHKASSENDLKTMERSLQDGVAVDAADKHGRTALIFACGAGHIEAVEFLLKKGANSNHAVTMKDREGATPLMAAAEKGVTQTIRLLVKHGAKVDQTAKNGVTALMLAAHRGRTQAVGALIEMGADVNRKFAGNEEGQGKGYTPLFAAAEGGDDLTCDVLIRSGADPTIQGADGKTCAEIAEEKGHKDLAKRLRGIAEDFRNRK